MLPASITPIRRSLRREAGGLSGEAGARPLSGESWCVTVVMGLIKKLLVVVW